MSLPPEEARRRSVIEFGVDPNSTANTSALQDAFDSGDALLVPKGLKVQVEAQLLIPSGLDLVIDGRIERTWGTGGRGGAGAMFRPQTIVNNVYISGNGSVGAPSHTVGGGAIFAGQYDDSVFSNFTVDTYWGGQAFVFGGHRTRMQRIRVINSAVTAGTGGIRFTGGDDFVAYGCHIESGDDALQFVPGEQRTIAQGQPPCRRGAYVGCTGFSTAGRFMVAGVAGVTDTYIEDCSFTACHGKASNRGVVVMAREDSPGYIRNLSFRDCTVDMENDASHNHGGLWIFSGSSHPAAYIDHVTFDNVNIRRTRTQGAMFHNIRRLVVNNCDFDAPRTSYSELVRISSCPDAIFTDNKLHGGGSAAALLLTGGAGAGSDRARIEGNHIAVTNGAYGIGVYMALDTNIEKNRFTNIDGSAAAGIRVQVAGTRATIKENDFTALAATTQMSIARGAQVYAKDNRPLNPTV